ncbi:unnamed protein product [Phyllotreta striolata]|uniref:E3 ubiquitin-protein ligase listerin n=1 Tax=Phyllotreta striolata TaxID=444603 RepID=A0A9N9XMF6_PHYSR|nr:unnamed protein product [Phyllotreta striolata]
MGGKHKVANRTKNNARPSNSGRSAELLGTSMPQFVGFSGVKDSAFGFSLSNPDEIETSLDPNIQVILKKIAKKDSTTKIKGLQEFAELVKESEVDIVKSILPVWPRFYNILATDTDNHVREATHNVHHQIVLKVKRNIAPYLKQLIAPWFTSQYDTYPPAASIASQAFMDAFPPNKIQEAIVFCQEEILNYLSDNLLVQTAQTLSNLKNVSAEEAEAKYERVLISCLQGYCLYLEKVSIEQIKNAIDLNNSIVSNSKFWKFSKSKVARVRASFFKIISVLCQKAPFLLEEKGSNVVNNVFNNLEEHDAVVLPQVWEAALLTVSNIKDWWTYINIEKLFLPKLWKILKQGGQGNASVIYPSLLPLISYLPPTIEETVPQFYSLFFENLWLGSKQKSTVASRSESVAVATAFVECLQYIILKKQSDLPFCKTLIKTHLLASIEWCLLEDSTNYKSLFNQIASLIQHWSRNLDSDGLKACLEFFLENVLDLFRDTLFNVKEIPCFDVESFAVKQLDFMQSLKCISKSKKQYKVKFCTDSESSSKQKPEVGNVINDKNYLDRLNIFAYNVSELYVQYTTEKKSNILIKHLYSLVINFDTECFFLAMSERLKSKNPDSTLADIYSNVLQPWLNTQELCCKHVVSLIFLLFEFLQTEDKSAILNTFLKVPSDECLSWCISEALSHPHNKNPLVKEWLRSERISKFIISITDLIIVDGCPPELGVLFKLSLVEDENGEILLHKEAVLSIVSKLTLAIENYTDHTITADTCTSQAAYISAIIYTENLLLTYKDTLLLALFRLSCNPEIDNEIVSQETMYEVTTSWQDALTLLTKNLSKEESLSLCSKLAGIIEDEFSKSDLSESKLNHFVKIIVMALIAVYKSVPLGLSEFFEIFLRNEAVHSSQGFIEELCTLTEFLNGNLPRPHKEIDPITTNVENIDVARYFAWIYLKIGVLSSSFGDAIDDEDDDDDDSGDEMERQVLILTVINQVEVYASQILHDLCVGETYLTTFNNVVHYDAILHYNVLTEMKVIEALKVCDKILKSNITIYLNDMSMKNGWYWIKAVYLYYSKIQPQDLCSVYEDFVRNIPDSEVEITLQATRIFKDHLTYDNVQNKFDAVGDIIVLRSLIRCEEIDVQIAEVFTKMVNIRIADIPKFLYNSSLISWQDCQVIVEIIRLCSCMMKSKFQCFNQKHWDFGIISLVSWASNCLKAKVLFDTYQYQSLLCAVVNLYVNTDAQMRHLKEQKIPCSYIDEWEEILVESTHNDLLQIWLYLADQLNRKQNITTFLPLIQEFTKIFSHVYCERVFKASESLPKWSKYLKQSCLLLTNSQPSLQLWGYKMLLAFVPGLVNIDAEAVSTNNPHKMGLIFEQFKEKLVETQDIVNSLLMEFKLGDDSCRVEPLTDSFTYTFAYLLLWDILLSLCEKSSTELRFQYADWLKNEDLLENLLNNLFRLMPAEVLQFSERKSKSLMEPFLRKPDISVTDTCDSEKIENLVCWIYSSTLAQLPAVVRHWWTSLDGKLSQIVEKVTQCYVSTHLVTQELNELLACQSKFKNMVLNVLPGAREIIAIYTVDEAQVELIITLPPNYPLGCVFVRCDKQIAGASLKQWLLQFKKCVVHQNGRIWDGLSLWNNNLDKKFDGVEECYICFAVLHPGTYQLPKLSCQTCKKKFHSACLYKWFRTSYKSSCPVCRNLF